MVIQSIIKHSHSVGSEHMSLPSVPGKFLFNSGQYVPHLSESGFAGLEDFQD